MLALGKAVCSGGCGCNDGSLPGGTSTLVALATAKPVPAGGMGTFGSNGRDASAKVVAFGCKLEAGNKVAIQFAAPTEADGKLFFDRIQSLPELAPYEVNVKVTTAK